MLYDSASNLATITHGVVGGASLATFRYGYDAANRLTSETNAEGSVTYTYDNSSQLTSVTGARSESYAYDASGNRDSTGYTVGTGGTITASPNATYTYDASGHLTARTDTSTGKVTTFAYDHRDRLTGITRKTSGGTVDYRTTYVYDALNRRIAEQVDADGAGAGSPVTTWTVFDGQNPYADFDGAGTLTQRYLHGAAVDALLARSDASGVTDWYLTDRLGSVRDVVDTSGTVLYHTGYDSFGNKVSTTGSGGDRYGFTGREHDAALNIYYYRARFYDPATGRFVSKDPLGYDAGDANLYRYVGNGPTNGTDPSGMISWSGITDWIGEKIIYPIIQPIVGDEALAGASDTDLVIGIIVVGGIAASGGGAVIAEEAAGNLFEHYTGLPLIVNPLDIAQQGTKRGAKEFASAYQDPKAWNSIVDVTQGRAAVSKSNYYSTAFEMRLDPRSYPGLSRRSHFREANESLLHQMKVDSNFAQSMKELGISLERTPTGLAPRTAPDGWIWHHATEPGVMQLVPKYQHTPGSVFWGSLHPSLSGAGGYALWGK